MGAYQFVRNFAYRNARYRGLDFCLYRFLPFFDMGETCFSRFDGNIGQVDVYRIARQILHEQIDCRAAVNGKTFFRRNNRDNAEQQPHSLFILLINHFSVLPEL